MVLYSKQKQTPPKAPPQQKTLTREERRKATFIKFNAKRSRLNSLQKDLQKKLEIKREKDRLYSYKYYHKTEKAGASTMSQQTPSRNTPRGNEPDPVTTPVSLVHGALLFRLTSPCLIAHAFPLSFRTVWGVWSNA